MADSSEDQAATGPMLFVSSWVEEPEEPKAWQAKSVQLSAALQKYKENGCDPFTLASLLRGLSIYGHDNLGTEIADIIFKLGRRTRDKHYDALRDRDQHILINDALNDDLSRRWLFQHVNKIRLESSRPLIHPDESRKIEIVNAVADLFKEGADGNTSGPRTTYDRINKRAQRKKQRNGQLNQTQQAGLTQEDPC